MPDIMNTSEAAQYVRLGKATLERFRCTGEGPLFVRLGDGPRGTVRYRRSDLDDWLAESTVDPARRMA